MNTPFRPSAAYDALRAFPLFTGLAEARLEELFAEGRVRKYEPGQHVFVCGDKAQSFYIVIDGTIQVFRETPDGYETTTDVLLAGDMMGDQEMFLQKPVYRFNAVAVKPSTLVEFSMDGWRESVKRTGALAVNLLSALSRRLHIASVESEHKATMSAAQQVACFLERLCVLHGYDHRHFTLPCSKMLIASRLGMAIETFSRALAVLRAHGIVVEGSHVSFRDFSAIEAFNCAHCSIAGNCEEHEELRRRMRA